MKEFPKVVNKAQCLFCLKWSGPGLVVIASPYPPRSYICQECIQICVKLVDSHYDPYPD